MGKDKAKIIDKIGELLCDQTAGRLRAKGQIERGDEEFGSLVTLTYLQEKIFKLLDQL